MIRGKLTAYAIIVLLKVSIRAQCKPQVHRIPHNVYQGFHTRVEAERAYVLAFAMGSLRILPRREALWRGSYPRMRKYCVSCIFRDTVYRHRFSQ